MVDCVLLEDTVAVCLCSLVSHIGGKIPDLGDKFFVLKY